MKWVEKLRQLNPLLILTSSLIPHPSSLFLNLFPRLYVITDGNLAPLGVSGGEVRNFCSQV